MGAKKLKEDVLTVSSQRKGLMGGLEIFMRRFRTLSFALMLLPLIFVCALSIGISAAPGLYVFHLSQSLTANWHPVFHFLAMGCGLSFGYFVYGMTLIFVVPLFNFLNPFKVKTFRGPWYSLPSVAWYMHNALTYMVRFTFLEFITPSPLNILFYRMMGMKIGKGVVINTTYISDPALITLGDYVTIGGSATIFAHSGQKGYLIIEPVSIGSGSNIGLKASIMGGVKIGEKVTVRPHTAVLPKTRIPDNTTV